MCEKHKTLFFISCGWLSLGYPVEELLIVTVVKKNHCAEKFQNETCGESFVIQIKIHYKSSDTIHLPVGNFLFLC